MQSLGISPCCSISFGDLIYHIIELTTEGRAYVSHTQCHCGRPKLDIILPYNGARPDTERHIIYHKRRMEHTARPPCGSAGTRYPDTNRPTRLSRLVQHPTNTPGLATIKTWPSSRSRRGACVSPPRLCCQRWTACVPCAPAGTPCPGAPVSPSTTGCPGAPRRTALS